MWSIKLRNSLLALAVLAGVYLLYFTPDHDFGWIGNLLLLGSFWTVLYLWTHRAPDDVPAGSLGEQLAGLSLGVTAVIAGIFVFKLQAMGWQVTEPGARSLSRGVVLMLVLSAVLASVLRRSAGQAAIRDERDQLIAARACAHAHIVLVVALIAVILNLGFGGSTLAGFAKPLNIAYWLIGLLILSSLSEHLSAVIQYRKDRA